MITVLLVDDDPMVAELNRLYVSRVEGFEAVASVQNAQQVLSFLAKKRVDLILLDIFMPGQDGLALLTEIRALGLDVDVILVTAAREMKTIGRALKLGAVDYLIKPFTFERLKKALDDYRETHRMMHAQRPISQTELDSFFNRRQEHAGTSNALPKGLDRATMARVWQTIQEWGGAHQWFTCEEIAKIVGISRVSIRKYVEFLCGIKVLRMEPGYGTVGRPVHRFMLQKEYEDELRRFL